MSSRTAYDAKASRRGALLTGNRQAPSQWVFICAGWYKQPERRAKKKGSDKRSPFTIK
jgi:hypothetical protein